MQNNIEEFLKRISWSVWDRIGFARTRRGLKIFETTITQNLLFNIMYAHQYLKLPIYLFEAHSEATNGNDIEFFIQCGNNYVLFPVQAKIIYPNNKYKMIDHLVGGKQQIDLLTDYAKQKQGYPIYWLYNYVNPDGCGSSLM
jgi:hypothetical protein